MGQTFLHTTLQRLERSGAIQTGGILVAFPAQQTMQKLQTVPQGRTVEAQWSKVLSDTDYQRGHNFWRSIPRLEYLLPAAAGLLILVLLTHPEAAWVVGLAIVAAVFLPYAVSYTRRLFHPPLICRTMVGLLAACILPAKSVHKIWSS